MPIVYFSLILPLRLATSLATSRISAGHGHRVSTPRRLWLGLLSYTLREHVVIAGVMPGSPGEKAGLRQGDLVLSADGRDIHERKALYEAINRHRPGEDVQLKIMRNNKVHDFAITTIVVDDYLG